VTFASIFTGGGGADIGLLRAGLEPIWFAEIDVHASAVLAYHHPRIQNFGDVTKIDETALPIPDVFWMSPPCQDLSVAGKRKGLDGKRSGLFYDGIRIAKHLVRNGTRYVCMEQVPGLFSSNGGEDFRSVLSEFLQLGPVDIGWRVLDSQYAGVAQRRERAFFVLDFGGKSVAEILSFPEGMSGHPKPRREKGSRIAASLTSGSAGSSNQAGRRSEGDFNIIPEVAAGGRCDGDMALEVTGSHAACCHAFPIQDSRVIEKAQGGVGIGCESSPMYTLDQTGAQAVAFTIREDATAPNGGNFHAKETDVALAINALQPGEQSHHAQVFIVDEAVQVQWASGGGQIENDTAQALHSNAEHSYQFVRQGFQIRRLTPRECERLQGWPDDWTRYGNFNGVVKEISDTQRYKIIGNGVTATISEMLGRKIQECQ